MTLEYTLEKVGAQGRKDCYIQKKLHTWVFILTESEINLNATQDIGGLRTNQ